MRSCLLWFFFFLSLALRAGCVSHEIQWRASVGILCDRWSCAHSQRSVGKFSLRLLFSVIFYSVPPVPGVPFVCWLRQSISLPFFLLSFFSSASLCDDEQQAALLFMFAWLQPNKIGSRKLRLLLFALPMPSIEIRKKKVNERFRRNTQLLFIALPVRPLPYQPSNSLIYQFRSFADAFHSSTDLRSLRSGFQSLSRAEVIDASIECKSNIHFNFIKN